MGHGYESVYRRLSLSRLAIGVEPVAFGLSCRLIVNHPGDKCVLFCQAGILFALNTCVRSNLLFSGLWYKSLPLLKLEPLALKAPHFRASMATRAACLANRVGSAAAFDAW
jgi:hypothetical protein